METDVNLTSMNVRVYRVLLGQSAFRGLVLTNAFANQEKLDKSATTILMNVKVILAKILEFAKTETIYIFVSVMKLLTKGNIVKSKKMSVFQDLVTTTQFVTMG